jgi:phosphotransferase system enzyme I (PtsI)
MTSLSGLAVHRGLFIGRAKLIQSPSTQIPSRRISTTEVPAEISALQESLNFLEKEFNHYLDNPSLSETEKDILQTHLMILRDPEIEKELLYTIESMHFTAAAAVSSVYSKICQQFKEMDNDFFAPAWVITVMYPRRIVRQIAQYQHYCRIQWESDQIAILTRYPQPGQHNGRCGLKAYCL